MMQRTVLIRRGLVVVGLLLLVPAWAGPALGAKWGLWNDPVGDILHEETTETSPMVSSLTTVENKGSDEANQAPRWELWNDPVGPVVSPPETRNGKGAAAR
jgi:hypothetical protein